MPHYTVTIAADGPVIDLGVTVGQSWERRLIAQRGPSPPVMTVRALIDTGSDLSVIHPRVLLQLGVQATGSIRIRRPGAVEGYRPALLCDVQLSPGGIGPDTLWISTRVVSVSPSTPSVFALIGRDVLERCTLFYNGPRGEVSLSC
jgi:hypothetical protein